MTMFGFVLQATIGGDDLSMHALLTSRASTSASCTRLRHILEMMEIEKLWVQEDKQQQDEEKHWRQNKDDKLITLIEYHGGDINNTASGVHAERTFRLAGCMMSSLLGDQVCVQGAVDLNDEQPIKTGSFFKMTKIKINKPWIQEEKRRRDQDGGDDEMIIALIDCPGGDIGTAAVHAERTFRPACCMMSSLGDQVCVHGALDLNNAPPLTATTSCDGTKPTVLCPVSSFTVVNHPPQVVQYFSEYFSDAASKPEAAIWSIRHDGKQLAFFHSEAGSDLIDSVTLIGGSGAGCAWIGYRDSRTDEGAAAGTGAKITSSISSFKLLYDNHLPRRTLTAITQQKLTADARSVIHSGGTAAASDYDEDWATSDLKDRHGGRTIIAEAFVTIMLVVCMCTLRRTAQDSAHRPAVLRGLMRENDADLLHGRDLNSEPVDGQYALSDSHVKESTRMHRPRHQMMKGGTGVTLRMCMTVFSVLMMATTTNAQAECAPGTFRANAQAECTDCSPGSYTDTLDADGATSCTACDPGQFNTVSTSACALCSAGTSQAAAGQTQCTDCAPGSYTDTLDADGGASCTACDAGQFNTVST
eukprot:COSAG06_NODE_6913_length_2719_cov_8.976718_2_plen_586_part_01